MATKIIKAWIDGAIQEIEVEDIVSPEQPLSVEDRLIELEDKPIITDGNILVGNGTDEMEEMTPEEVLSHINGASVTTMTTAEYEELEESNSINANTLYMLSDAKELWNIEVTISEDGLPSLVDATPMQVVDAIDDGVNVCLYITVSTDEVRYYHMNERGTNSFGDYINFVYGNSTEIDTITISRNGRNGTIGRLITSYDSSDVIKTPVTAEIGQTIIVKEVDENGKPISWEAGNSADNLLFDRKTCMLYLMSNGQVMGNGVYVETVEGGGNNAVLTLESTTDWSNMSIAINSDCIISFRWSSIEDGVNTGSGTVFVKVGGVLKDSSMVNQGECSINIGNCLSLGYNLVHVSVFDNYGNSQTLTFGVNMYDPDNLKSVKLVERTLNGDYVNPRVRTVGEKAFSGCAGIMSISLPNATRVSGDTEGAFSGLTLNNLNLSKLTEVEYYQFNNVKVTSAVELPSVITVDDAPFGGFNAPKVVLQSLTEISGRWLRKCSVPIFDFHKLQSLSITGDNTATSKTIIIRTPNAVCTLGNATALIKAAYVPSALLADYKVATNWSEIADSIYAIEDHPEICGGE